MTIGNWLKVMLKFFPPSCAKHSFYYFYVIWLNLLSKYCNLSPGNTDGSLPVNTSVILKVITINQIKKKQTPVLAFNIKL